MGTFGQGRGRRVWGFRVCKDMKWIERDAQALAESDVNFILSLVHAVDEAYKVLRGAVDTRISGWEHPRLSTTSEALTHLKTYSRQLTLQHEGFNAWAYGFLLPWVRESVNLTLKYRVLAIQKVGRGKNGNWASRKPLRGKPLRGCPDTLNWTLDGREPLVAHVGLVGAALWNLERKVIDFRDSERRRFLSFKREGGERNALWCRSKDGGTFRGHLPHFYNTTTKCLSFFRVFDDSEGGGPGDGIGGSQ